jgi:hypothetical protein
VLLLPHPFSRLAEGWGFFMLALQFFVTTYFFLRTPPILVPYAATYNAKLPVFDASSSHIIVISRAHHP